MKEYEAIRNSKKHMTILNQAIMFEMILNYRQLDK